MIRFFRLLFVLLVVIGGGGFYLVEGRRELPKTRTVVNIPPGSTLAEAARRLDDAGVASAKELRLYGRIAGRQAHVQAGALVFAPHENLREVFEHLTVRAQTESLWVTIPEGFTAKEIGERLSSAGIRGGDAFARYALTHSIELDGKRTKNLEGFLFPDTYLFGRSATSQEIADAMTAEFRRRLPRNAAERARALHLTLPEIVTVASLIEREAKVVDEQPLMAGVYYHRMRIGMPLEVDATLEYTKERHAAVLGTADVRRDTPYNTYLHQGLPPTPIANPGAPALRAALNPKATPYLYYVYKGEGRHAFAKTYAEHNANIERYLR